MNYQTATPTVAAQPVNYTPSAPTPNQGFGPYTLNSFGTGFQQLGNRLSNDAAGILDWAAGALGFSNPANQAAAQAAIAANPSLADPSSPNYQGAFIGPQGNAPGIGSEPGMLLGDVFSGGAPLWLYIGLGVAVYFLLEPRRD